MAVSKLTPSGTPQLTFTSHGESDPDGSIAEDLSSSLSSSTTAVALRSRPVVMSASVALYPASELPFASEPALETELETELPPLKKLRPTRYASMDDVDHEAVSLFHDQPTQSRAMVCNLIKGILTKRDLPLGPTCTSPVNTSLAFGPLTTSPASCATSLLDPSAFLWRSGNGLNSLTPMSLSTLVASRPTIVPLGFSLGSGEASRPVSRRSSSGQSAVSSTNSLKAVRFASGNGFSPLCEHAVQTSSSEDDEPHRCCRPAELEGPVAAIMYLTHSAEAYDRSPIVVEKGLRLPPRQDAAESGRWIQCGRASVTVGGRSKLNVVPAHLRCSSKRSELVRSAR